MAQTGHHSLLNAICKHLKWALTTLPGDVSLSHIFELMEAHSVKEMRGKLPIVFQGDYDDSKETMTRDLTLLV